MVEPIEAAARASEELIPFYESSRQPNYSVADVRAAAYRAGQEAMRARAADAAQRHGHVVSNEPIGQACSRNIASAIAALPLEDMPDGEGA